MEYKKDQVDSFGPRPQYKNLEKKLGLSILDVDRLSIQINICEATQFFFWYFRSFSLSQGKAINFETLSTIWI